MANINETLIEQLKRLNGAFGMQNPNYAGWECNVIDGMGGGWGVSLEGPTNFYKILVNPDGTIKGALAGRTGQRGEPTNLGAETLVRLLSGFQA